MSPKRSPIWELVIEAGYAASRVDAEKVIRAGLVKIDGSVVDKPGTLIRHGSSLLVGSTKTYVSRGGFKLERALDRFRIDPKDSACVDLGASTGGFTDLLLQRGAKKVFAIDVGYGELDYKLRKDPRVVVMERTNARFVTELPEPITLVVGDLSFISLSVFYPVIRSWIEMQGQVILLVKPQFEAGREEVPEGGVVVDPAVHRSVLSQTLDSAASSGFTVRGLIPSPIRGGSGNKEFLLWLENPEKAQELSPDAKESLINGALSENIDSTAT